jgi:hypothetical protein
MSRCALVALILCATGCGGGATTGPDASVDGAAGYDGGADVVAADADAATTCPSGPFGGGAWPPGCWRPYAATSAFNTKVPASPPLMSNSAAIIQRVLGYTTPIASGATQPGNMAAFITHYAGWPTYWARASDPVFNVVCNEFGGGCSVAASGITLHAPAGATIQDGCGANAAWDRHMTIVDQPSGWEYDLWHVSTCPLPSSGGTITIGWGGRARIDGSGMDTPGGNGMASGTANLAGRIRVEEMAAGRIDHALNVVIDCDNGTNVPPALAHDKQCADTTDAPPMGARLQLDMTAAEIDALAVPAWKKTILHALAEYGAIFGDTGSSFFFDWQTEDGSMYTTMGASSDPWIDFAIANGWPYYEDPSLGASDPYRGYVGSWHDGDDGIASWRTTVWSRLRVLDPCVSTGTCP